MNMPRENPKPKGTRLSNLVQITKQCVRGAPYLQKELARHLSLSVDKVLSTPVTYYVIPTGRCNLACTFCEIYKKPEPALPGETLLRIIREAKELSGKCFNISMSGGEPTIYKPLYDALELSHGIGINFGFTTNGLALNEKIVQRILSFDPFNINVSLESVDAKINESLRRPNPDGTRKVLEGLENLCAEKERTGSRVSLIVKPTIMEQNYRSLPDMVRYFGKGSKVLLHFQPYVGLKGDPHWVRDPEALKAVLEEILDLQRLGHSVIGDKHQFEGFVHYVLNPPIKGSMAHMDLGGAKRNCDIGLRSMFIYPNGDVFFCDFLGRPIGSVHQQSLSDIYYGAIAGGQRDEMVYCDIDCQQTCKRSTPLSVKARAFLRMG
jgi:sulfatase maturation enzyme AslB (radical SAM superfamily)